MIVFSFYVEHAVAMSHTRDLPDDPMEVDPAPSPLASTTTPPALEGLPFPGRLVDGVHEVVHYVM